MQVWAWALGGVLAVAGGQSFDSTVVAKAQSEIGSACGHTPVISVQWEEFGDDENAAQGLIESGLGFLSGSFAELCKDATLKAETKKQIAKIVLTQAYGAADPVIYLTRGTLHIEYLWAEGEPGPAVAFVRAEIVARLRGDEAEAP